MPKRHMALIGHFGKAVVEFWLRSKFCESDGHTHYRQLIPKEVPQKDGPYLDFGVGATLLLIPLSREFINAGAPQGSVLLPLGNTLKQAKFFCLTGRSLPVLGLGGSLFTWMLFRFRLLPRSISVVGSIGYALVFFGGIAGRFDLVETSPGGSGTFLAVPVAVFEIVPLPFWLLFKGLMASEVNVTAR